MPANYDDPETNGIIIPHSSPVYSGTKKQKRDPVIHDFAMLKSFAFNHLNPNEFFVYAGMLILGGFKKGTRVITNGHLVELTGMTKKAIERAQKDLKAKGFVKRHKSPYKLGALWEVFTESEDILREADRNVLFGNDFMRQKQPDKIDP